MISIRVPTCQGELSVIQSGAGGALPVLFLHADAGRAAHWQEVQLELAPERRVVAFDFPGCGESEPARDQDYGFAARADAVASVADALALARFVVVAHSGGAAVALQYGARHATRVAGMLLVDPPTDPRALPEAVRAGFVRDLAGPRSLEVQQQYYRSIAGPDAGVGERIAADCVAVVPAARAGFGLALANWDPEPALDAWRGPLRVLGTAANDTEHAIYRLRNVPHEVVAGTGHWLQLERPSVVAQAVRNFVAALESASP